MANLEENLEGDTDKEAKGNVYSLPNKKKKLLLIITPMVAIIGILWITYSLDTQKKEQKPTNYRIIHQTTDDGQSSEKFTIFYDLPELTIYLKDQSSKEQVVKIKLSIELSKMEDITLIEALTAKITDIITAHLIDLRMEEINNSEGLYWLRKEILYRLNLVVAPVHISALNFKNFEIIKN